MLTNLAIANSSLGFWTNKEAAIAGGKGPLHKQARAIIPKMYESIHVTGLRFTILDDVKGSVGDVEDAMDETTN